MNWSKIWNDPVWSKVIAGLILGVLGICFRYSEDPVYTAIILFLLIVVGCSLLWFTIRSSIRWEFDNFLAMVGGGGDLRIISFQASGYNRSRAGIQSVKGYLVSNIDNTVSDNFRFVIDGFPVEPQKTTGIPPSAHFQVMIPLCDTSKGYEAYLTENEFLKKWATFRFVYEDDKPHTVKTFSKREVKCAIQAFNEIANLPPKAEVKIKEST